MENIYIMNQFNQNNNNQQQSSGSKSRKSSLGEMSAEKKYFYKRKRESNEQSVYEKHCESGMEVIYMTNDPDEATIKHEVEYKKGKI